VPWNVLKNPARGTFRMANPPKTPHTPKQKIPPAKNNFNGGEKNFSRRPKINSPAAKK
jgi:hypothetical protein